MYQRQTGRGGKARGRGRLTSRGGRSFYSSRNADNNDGFTNSRSWGAGRVIHEVLPESYAGSGGLLHVAVQGCCHGQLDQIYKTIEEEELRTGIKVDLLLCCGDFQSVRNISDLDSMAVPDKYKEIGTFYKYYSGEVTAPVLTIFIGGNHEASLPLQELFYGGWVAENIYYLGSAGVVNFGGLRIAGLSGIYKEHDYDLGHFERPPYNPGTLRSIYHVRNVEAYRLLQLRSPGCEDVSENIDIMLTHDWPRGIERYGDTQSLLRKKKFFRHEVETNTLGSPVGENLLHTLQPKRWFSAHLHVKFEATVYHQKNETIDHQQSLCSSEMKVEPTSSLDSQLNWEYDDVCNKSTQFSALEPFGNYCKVVAAGTLSQQMTKFLALDKCLPQRNFVQIISIARPESEQGRDPELKYDIDWLVILYKTAHLTVGAKRKVHIPATPLEITQQDRNEVMQKFNFEEGNEPKSTSSGNLRIPLNFRITAPPHHQESLSAYDQRSSSNMIGNPQTDQFLKMLGVQHIITVPYSDSKDQVQKVANNPKEVDSMREDKFMGYDRPEPDSDEIPLPEDEESEEMSVGSTAKRLDEHRIPPGDDYATSVNSPEVKRPRND